MCVPMSTGCQILTKLEQAAARAISKAADVSLVLVLMWRVSSDNMASKELAIKVVYGISWAVCGKAAVVRAVVMSCEPSVAVASGYRKSLMRKSSPTRLVTLRKPRSSVSG